LKTHVETPKLTAEFRRYVDRGDAEALDKLLRKSKIVRDLINEPIFAFDSPAILRAGNRRPVAEVLLRHGADPNARSRWWAGSFGALDFATPEYADFLIAHGAKLDVWSAASLGRVAELAAMLDENPELVNAPGGDGMRPLHFASTVEIAELLLDRGGDPNLRDVDHEGTAAQHQIKRPEIARLLLQRGATPDVFLAAALDDEATLRDILDRDPSAVDARVGEGEFATKQSDGGHIYLYNIGGGKTPLHFAIERGSTRAVALLESRSTPGGRLIAACLRQDEALVERLLAEHPGLGAALPAQDARALPDAAGEGKLEAVELMLKAGIDPYTKGMDTGTALHTAAWYGHADVVARMVREVPLSTRDDVHGSTPLGWAAHGAQWCRNPRCDYPRVVEILLEAGADITAKANSGGTSILDQAGEREDVKAVLRKHGAK